MTSSDPDRRGLAWGGIVGPAAFVSAWAVGGARQTGYSPVTDAISELAGIGASSRPLMSAGLVAFGVGVPLYAVALRTALPGRAWTTAAATGLASLAIAALPLHTSPTIDHLHGASAIFGYVTLAATPLLAAQALRILGHRRAAAMSLAASVASGLCLAASALGPAHGLWQRAGLTVGHAWVVASAAWMLTGRLGMRSANR